MNVLTLTVIALAVFGPAPAGIYLAVVLARRNRANGA